MEGFWFGAVLGVVVVIALAVLLYRRLFRDAGRRAALWQLIWPAQPPAREVEIELLTDDLVPSTPDYGNIRPVRGEEDEPTEFGPLIHEFPEQKAPETAFEDFNRRLFIYVPAERANGKWPDTTDDDFATLITGLSYSDLMAQAGLRLRPRYPVIIDNYGWWAAASAQLEHDPDYADSVTRTYLSVPEAVRPVVISRRPGLEKGALIFLRYGFENWVLGAHALRFHYDASLRHILAMFIGARRDWMWLSVARLRQTVIRAAQSEAAAAAEAERQQAAENERYLATQIKRKREELAGNRWRHLWDVRPKLAEPATDPEGMATAPAAGTASDTASSGAVA